MRRRRATSTKLPAGSEIPSPTDLAGVEAPFLFDVRELGATERREDGTFASTRRCWFRIREPLPDDPAVHACLLAYFSDMTGAAFRPGSMGAWGTHTDTSLDHAVWFHRPWRADAWSIFDCRPWSMPAGKGHDSRHHARRGRHPAPEHGAGASDPRASTSRCRSRRRRGCAGSDPRSREGTMGLLDGHRAIVTGGGSGIGRGDLSPHGGGGGTRCRGRYGSKSRQRPWPPRSAEWRSASTSAIPTPCRPPSTPLLRRSAACRSSTTTLGRPPSTDSTSSTCPNGTGCSASI